MRDNFLLKLWNVVEMWRRTMQKREMENEEQLEKRGGQGERERERRMSVVGRSLCSC